MTVRRFAALVLFSVFALFGSTACTVEGQGTKTECAVSGCTITFDRGVNAKASVLGVDAELVAVDGNTVTLKVGGQQVSVPVGETKPADGLSVNVQSVTADKVIVKVTTGITTG
ncbi:hypothetical protein [Nocardia sp. NPDC049149]|uniref:hypothetical protein n=1 Tax=Nocardia sp. NPDC049149 TaxID=3364315 RepID=UPI0037119A64